MDVYDDELLKMDEDYDCLMSYDEFSESAVWSGEFPELDGSGWSFSDWANEVECIFDERKVTSDAMRVGIAVDRFRSSALSWWGKSWNSTRRNECLLWVMYRRFMPPRYV